LVGRTQKNIPIAFEANQSRIVKAKKRTKIDQLTE